MLPLQNGVGCRVTSIWRQEYWSRSNVERNLFARSSDCGDVDWECRYMCLGDQSLLSRL